MPERRDSGEGLHNVLSLPQQLSNCRSIVRAEATSRHARCLPVSRGCRHGEVNSGEARSTTLLPLPRNPHPGVLMARHLRGTVITRGTYPVVGAASYLGVPQCPSRLAWGRTPSASGKFFLPAPFASIPPLTRGVSTPLRLLPLISTPFP